MRTDSVTVCGVKVLRVYGPVPTGFSLVKVVGSGTSFQMCSGTMNELRILFSFTNWGLLKVISAEVSLTLLAPAIGRPLVLRADLSFSRLNV